MMEHPKLTSKPTLTLIWKLILSLLASLYIIIIVIFPNGGSYLGRSVGNFLAPIANTMGLNATWNFFSPDPANTMYFAYNVYFENEDGSEQKESIAGFLPPEKNQIVTDASRRRMLYAMRFLILDERRLNAIMAPWLCKKNPGASRVSIRFVIEKIPSLDDAKIKKSLALDELREQTDSRSGVFDCRQAQDEVGL